MNKISYFNTKNGMSHGCNFFKTANVILNTTQNKIHKQRQQ